MKNIQLTIVLSLLSFSIIAQISKTEKQALQDLYTSTNGSAWTSTWDITQSPTTWKGVTITDNKVVGISLLFNNMEGKLPKTIGQLSHLKTLELSFNKLEGTLPLELGNLKNLEVLAFNGNNLVGNIPNSIGNLKSLTQLHLSSNQLTGQLPESIANLNYLEVLNVFDNNLSGNLPEKLASSRNLKQLMVAENNFNDTQIFSKELLSNGASVNLHTPFMVSETKEVIATETEDEN